MKKIVVFAGMSSVLLLGFIAVKHLAGQTTPPPAVLAATVSPETAIVSQAITAKVTVPIPSASSLPLNVNLLRVEPNGTSAVVGVLKDDGLTGDAKAGDRLYSAQVVINEPQPKTVQWQVSAAFRGQLKRVLSNVVQLAVSAKAITLPPDPAEAGKATLAGIDSDRDGVRDDVQRYIVFTYPESEKLRLALFDYSRSRQPVLVTSSSTKDQLFAQTKTRLAAVNCLSYIAGFQASAGIADQVRRVVLNTPGRIAASASAEVRVGAYIYEPPEDLKSDCRFDPDKMEN